MNKKLTLAWLKAAAIRAAKTVAQTAMGMVTVNVAITSVDWKYIALVSAMSGVYSIITSVATKLPEIDDSSVS